MQLHTLEIINFQAHRKRVLEFSPRITTIQGATDIGKSAIIRALRWICLNGITGVDFIRHGKTEAQARLKVVHQRRLHTILRTRGKENSYHLESKKFVAFGSSVPQDIRDLLQITEINFQNQFDSPFWFGKTAGEVSRELNAIIDLSVIDHSLDYAAALVRRCQERKSVSEERMKAAEEEYENLQAQKKRVEEFDSLSQQRDRAEKAQADFDRMDLLLSEFYSHRDHLRECRGRSRQMEQVVLVAERVWGVSQRRNDLESLLESAATYSAQRTPPPLKDLDQAFLAVQECKTAWDRLEGLVGDLKRGLGELKRAKDAHSVAETKLHLRTKDETCPLCGQLIQRRR